jgi:hypothetical protein
MVDPLKANITLFLSRLSARDAIYSAEYVLGPTNAAVPESAGSMLKYLLTNGQAFFKVCSQLYLFRSAYLTHIELARRDHNIHPPANKISDLLLTHDLAVSGL